LVEQEIDLFQRFTLALRNTEVNKHKGSSHDASKDEANFAVQAGVLVVDEIWDAEVDSEARRVC
jgi:hypothetical protein